MEETKVYAYRHKKRKDLYLIRVIIDEDGSTQFKATTDPSFAIYAYSADKETYDYLVNNSPEEPVGYIEDKNFEIDGYVGVLYKTFAFTLGDFEKVEFKEQ